MEQIFGWFGKAFPDALFYGLTVIAFLIGLFKCCRPVFRATSALSHAAVLLEDGAKARLARPVWSDTGFLGKSLQPVWRVFLRNVNAADVGGTGCDVAEYIHEEAIITDIGKAPLADMIPGVCTSLGILGTFVGLSMGLEGLDIMKLDSYIQLTTGIALAFNTSIVGLIASLTFNVINKYAAGRARVAIDRFVASFYANALAQPPDIGVQILTLEREQSDALGRFADDMSVRMAGEIQHAISGAMSPVQQSMSDFLRAATRAQVDGLDYIVARFIDRMNIALDGQIGRLREALEQTADGQFKARDDLRSAVDSIGQLTQSVIHVQGMTEEVVNKFTSYVAGMNEAYARVGESQNETAGLLDQIETASMRQARYLSALQEYQMKLQASFQDYSVWTDKFVTGLEKRTSEQNESLEQITLEMRASSDLLRGAYKSFVESIELGLANALGLFDENMQNLTRQIHGTLSDIRETMLSLEGSMTRVAINTQADREVS